MLLLTGYMLVFLGLDVKVFISSVVGGMEYERGAAAGAVHTLRHEVIRAYAR
jgi:hypothetical protein